MAGASIRAFLVVQRAFRRFTRTVFDVCDDSHQQTRYRPTESQLDVHELVSLPAVASSDSIQQSSSSEASDDAAVTRPASVALVKALGAVVGSDGENRRLQEIVTAKQHIFMGALNIRAENEPRIKRLRADGRRDDATEAKLRDLNLDQGISDNWRNFKDAERAAKKASEQRATSFIRLYSIAQTELDYEPPAGEAVVNLPEELFDLLQRMVDTNVATCEYRAWLRRMRTSMQRLEERDRNEYQPNAERMRVADDMKEARGAALGYLELQQKKEGRFVDMLRSSQLCNDESGPEERARRLVLARRKVHRLERRFERLKRRYYPDLLRSLQQDRTASRTAFDQNFFRARNQATREWLEADDQCRGLQKQMQTAHAVPLADITSDFGSISGDGESQTIGEMRKREWYRRRELNRPRIENYRSRRVLAGAPVRVSAVPSEPSRVWSGKSIQWGRSDCPSNEAVNSSEKKRIQEWNRKMSVLHAEPSCDVPDTGYRGGGFEADKAFGFGQSGIPSASSFGIFGCC